MFNKIKQTIQEVKDVNEKLKVIEQKLEKHNTAEIIKGKTTGK